MKAKEFHKGSSYSREINGETVSVTRYDMNDFFIHFSGADTSMRGTAFDVAEELATHFKSNIDDIITFAKINFGLDEPLMTTTIHDVAVSNVWMDSSARFPLYTMRSFDEWGVQGVVDFVIDAAEYINTHKFQVKVLKNLRIQDLPLIRLSFESAKASSSRQNIVLVEDGIYLTFKAKLPDEQGLQFGELVCWVEDEAIEDDNIYDCIANAVGDFYTDTDNILNERILSGKINFTKY